MPQIPLKYFGTDGIRGPVGSPVMSPAFVLQLGLAIGFVLSSKPQQMKPVVAIGRDTRVSGSMIQSALQAGIAAAGVDIILVGEMPTPAVAYLVRALRLSAGISISASHNPFDDNGIKIFNDRGEKIDADVEHLIEQTVERSLGCAPSERVGRVVSLDDASGRYIDFCKSTFPAELNLRGMKIVIDGAHGAAHQIAPTVFRELGATVIEVGCAPNGFNINERVGATYTRTLQEKVLEHRADLGIALDGDADRLQIVDRNGRLINGDELLYIIVKDRMCDGKVSGVVGTVMTNYAFEQKMDSLNVAFHRTDVGDKNVTRALNDRQWTLGGESSGHILCLDRHSTGDGIIAALQVLRAVRRDNQELADLLSDFQLLPQKSISVRLPAADKPWTAHPKLNQACRDVAEILKEKGRMLIRPSGTEAKLRLMVEACDEELATFCIEKLHASLNEQLSPF